MTATSGDDNRTNKFAAVLKTHSAQPAEPRKPRRRWVPKWMVTCAVLAVPLGLGVAAIKSSGFMSADVGDRQILVEKVHRADLVVSILEDGNVESAANVDIKCEVKNGSTILTIVKDGTQVQQGDELARLDSANIEDQIMQQEIVVSKAKAAAINSQKAYDSAVISVKEYEEGLYQQTLQSLQAQVTVAKKNLESSKSQLEFTERMLRKGYVNELQRDTQAFAVENNRLNLEMAETNERVLEEFTKEKTLTGLRATAESAKAQHESDEAALELEQSRLERLHEQLENCTITAPSDGMVIFANDNRNQRGGAAQALIEEGAIVRERQTIIRLPDLSKMQVKTLVHESKVDMLRRGMRASIQIQGKEYQGTVTKIASQPEPSDFFTGNVKEYATLVSIDSDPAGLRPGMTAAVEILICNIDDALSVPVESVVQLGNKFYCWIDGANGPEQRPVVLGMSNNTRIEVKDGLLEGQSVLKNPRAVVAAARSEVQAEEQVDVSKRFGGDRPSDHAASNERATKTGGISAAADATDNRASRQPTPDRPRGAVQGQGSIGS